MKTISIARSILIILVCSFPLLAGSGEAAVEITPSLVEVDLADPRAAGRFEVVNTGSLERHYRMRIVSLGDDRSASGLTERIRLEPREFTIAPGTRRVVRFLVRPHPGPMDGEYGAGIELISPDGSRRLVPVFGRASEVDRSGSVTTMEASLVGDRPVLHGTVANTGEGMLQLTGRYSVVDNLSGTVVFQAEIGEALILPDGELSFRRRVPARLPAGDYRVSVQFDSPGLAQPIVRSVPLLSTGLQAALR